MKLQIQYPISNAGGLKNPHTQNITSSTKISTKKNEKNLLLIH